MTTAFFCHSMLAGIAGTLLSLPVNAADLDWSIESAAGHTDNATRVNNGEITDTIGSIGGHIEVSGTGSRISGRLRGDGRLRSYFDDTYDDDFLGSGAADLRVKLVGEALTWSFSDAFGQVLTDTFEPSTPDNRENLNVFSTGPDLRIRLARGTEVIIRGRIEDASYENSDSVDSQQLSADIGLVRHLSSATAWSVNASSSTVDYDESGNSGYDQQELFLRLESASTKQNLTADIGAGFLGGGDQSDEALIFRLDWMRHVSASWTLELGLHTEFGNSDDQFVRGISGGGELGGTQDVVLTGQAMRDDRATFGLNFTRSRTQIRLFGDIGSETYPDVANADRERWAMGAEISRRLTPRLEATLRAHHEDRDFDTVIGDDNTDIFGAQLDWRLGKALYLGFEGRREKRSGDTSFSYTENIYLASISYRPGTP
jgi:hypothetical protein